MADEVRPMDIIVEQKAEQELFPRWFNDTDCTPDCVVCVKQFGKHERDSGSFGEVYLQDQTAIKMIKNYKGIACSTAIREVMIYNKIGTKSPHVVRCIKCKFDEMGNAELTLERADMSLLSFSRCSRFRATVDGYEQMSVHFVLWSLLKSVSYLNSCQVMHRDIKPGNVLVFGGPRLALCDMGGARLTKAEITVMDMRMSDSVCTKHYAPPEEQYGKHNMTFDSFSVAATVMHYAMSTAPMYQPMNKVSRKTFVKFCKPHPDLLLLLKMLTRKNPENRASAHEALSMFEMMFPHLVCKYNQYYVSGRDGSTIPPRFTLAENSHWQWDRLHMFSNQVWPCIIECIYKCQTHSGAVPVVAFYVLNLLYNLMQTTELCNDLNCYVMFLPTFLRASLLMVGSYCETEKFLESFHEVFLRHRCVQLHHCLNESLYACQALSNLTVDWMYPQHLSTLVQVQDLCRIE